MTVAPDGNIDITHGCSRTVDIVNPGSRQGHEVRFGSSSGACHLAIP
jgi:hypothetical protein